MTTLQIKTALQSLLDEREKVTSVPHSQSMETDIDNILSNENFASGVKELEMRIPSENELMYLLDKAYERIDELLNKYEPVSVPAHVEVVNAFIEEYLVKK